MDCTTNGLEECVNPIAGINIPSNGILLTYIEDNVLDELCSNYESVEGCVETSIVHCSEKERLKISSKNSALKYLCTVGYQGYKNSRSCFDNDTLLDRVRSCNSTFTTEVSEIQHIQDQTFNTKKENLCKSMKDLITCIKDSTHEVCGTEASDWIYNIKTRMLSGSMSQICPNTQRDQLPTILAVSFAVFVAVVVIGLAFMIIYKKVQSEDDNTKINTVSGNRTEKNSTPGDRHSLQPLFSNNSKGSNNQRQEDRSNVTLEEINENGSMITKHSKMDDSSCAKMVNCNTLLNSNNNINRLVENFNEVQNTSV